MTTEKSIKLEIHSRNEVNKMLMAQVKFILPQLVAFMDKKIFTLKGRAKSFVINFLDNPPTPFEGGHAQVNFCYLDYSYSKLVLKYRHCYNGGSYDNKTAYTKYTPDKQIELGAVVNDKLVSIYTLEEIIKYYGLAEVLNYETEIKNIKIYKQAKEVAEKAKQQINISEEFYKYL